MKNKLLLSLISIFFLAKSNGFSQVAVTLLHNGVTQVFYGTQPFLSAYNAAINGDTIYLPGFNFSAAQPGAINKRITVVGTGHYPDSTQATRQTIISGFTLQAGSDKSMFEGLTINGNIVFENDVKIDSVTFRRNKINGNITFSGTNTATECADIQIYQNVVSSVVCQHASAAKIFNNIIQGSVSAAKDNTWVYNNLFFSSYALVSSQFVLFENNVLVCFGGGNVQINSFFCEFKNNILCGDPTGDMQHTWSGNSINQTAESLMVSVTSGAFNYAHNYHLITPSSFPGTDNTQVGIYGGTHPYKEGAVPFNPHIQSKTIAPTTDVNGDLNINIKVAAQD